MGFTVKKKVATQKLGATETLVKKSLAVQPAESLEQRLLSAPMISVAIDDVLPNLRNAKKHNRAQIAHLAELMKKFGQAQPIVIDEAGNLLAGHCRLLAAKSLGMARINAISLPNLTQKEKRVFSIADNKVAQSPWDLDLLAEELQLIQIDPDAIDFSLTGFDLGEVEGLIVDEKKSVKRGRLPGAPPTVFPVSKAGDIWICGEHRLLCGDATREASFRALMGEERARVLLTGAPTHNIAVRREIKQRKGARPYRREPDETSIEEYEELLELSLAWSAEWLAEDGGAAYVGCDWKNYSSLLRATEGSFGWPRHLLVWAESTPGTGEYYGSQHQFVLFFDPRATHDLLRFRGRKKQRGDIWRYELTTEFGPQQDYLLRLHGAIQPVDMVVDALSECSGPSEIVLDPFGGTGTTMIAAECAGRRANLIEIDPLYCDTIVRRWQDFTGGEALHAVSGKTFDGVRRSESPGTVAVEKEVEK